MMFLLFALYIAFADSLAWYFDGLFVIAGFVDVLLFTQFFFNNKIALYSMGTSVVDEDDGPRVRKLHAMVDRLSRQTGLPKPKVAITDTHIPNTFAARHSQKSSTTCITTGLMETLGDDELEGVITHELAHVKNRDVMVMTIASFLFSIAFLIVCWSWLFDGNDNHQNAPVIVIIIVSLVIWIISCLLIRVFSRYHEYVTNYEVTVITDHPSALVSALLRISGRMGNVPERDIRDTSEISAFFIIPIEFDFVGRLFSTHPFTENRVERLHDMEHEIGTA